MKKIKIFLPIFFFIILIAFAFNNSHFINKSPIKTGDNATFDNLSKYKVAKVHDGDTIDIMIGARKETVRLIGVDTPEVNDPRKVVQCFGKEASIKTQELLSEKEVYLEYDPVVGERDKYNRLLAYVYLPDKSNLNLVLIEQGYAHEYTYASQPYKYRDEFKNAQVDAKENKRGLWASSTCDGDTKQPAS